MRAHQVTIDEGESRTISSAGAIAVSVKRNTKRSAEASARRAAALAATVEIAVLDPRTQAEVAPGRIGEIWLASHSDSDASLNGTPVASVRLPGRGTLRFQRTGDLGCLLQGTLFIVAESRDAIELGGRQHRPEDLERSIQASNSLLAADGGAAFTVADDAGHSLVIVQELSSHGWRIADAEEVVADICEALAQEYGVVPKGIALVRPGTLPRTIDGAVCRTRCRAQYESDELQEINAYPNDI